MDAFSSSECGAECMQRSTATVTNIISHNIYPSSSSNLTLNFIN